MRVVVVDGDPRTLRNLKQLPEFEPDLEVAGTATDWEEALAELHLGAEFSLNVRELAAALVRWPEADKGGAPSPPRRRFWARPRA